MSTKTRAGEVTSLRGEVGFDIFYEDTDLSGFVYHANYLKYFERARELLVGIRFLKDLKADTGIHFVVASAEVKFKHPASHGDHLIVKSDVEISHRPSHTYHQQAFVGAKLCCDAFIRIATLNGDNRPVRLPPAIWEKLSSKNN